MTKRIFHSIFLVALAVLFASMVLIMGAVYNYFTATQFQQLQTQTTLAAQAVSNEGLAYFESLEDPEDCRITWIAADGTVLYDNRTDSDAMENHLAREEIQDALAGGYGKSARYSDTLMDRYLYTAQRLSDGTVLRLSTSQTSVLHLMVEMFQPILAVILIAVVLSLWLSSRVAKGIVKPLNELNLDDPLSNREYEEITPLLQRLDSQQQQLKSQEKAMYQKQKEFNTVTRALNEGLVLVSSGGVILSINPAAAKLLDVTPNCAGADFSVANRNRDIAALVNTALTGEKAERTLSLSFGEYQVTASPVKSKGHVLGVVLLLFDVTQKLRAEQLRREFTANVSHELKTPLHAISGYAELLKSGMVPQEDTRHFAEKIYAEAHRMIQLVEDTLRLSRLDEGAADMQWAPIDLYAAAQATVKELTAPAELESVSLKLEGSSTVIHGISQLVSSILFNLVDNAVKYNKHGGLVLIRVGSEHGRAILSVSDTGIGIPEDHLPRIFERFYRVDKSHSKEVGGTGLGLSIVKHAVLILGGSIEVDSTPGKGTIMTVYFPLSQT